MEVIYIVITSLLFLLIIILLVFLVIKNKTLTNVPFDYNNIIQKNTQALFFDTEGLLLSTSPSVENQSHLISLKLGEHVSSFTRFESIDRYFESCKKFKKTISIKLIEEQENEIGRRHDLIFTPFLKNNELVGIFIISQEVVSHNKEKMHFAHQKKLEDQRNYALKQVDEIGAQKSELELAFKKSSKHHIMLQKALRQIETQKSELESALDIINNQKLELEKANKEIKEGSKLKEIFLANTSHEIRTPLNAIIGFTNLLFDTSLDKTQTKYIDNIRASGDNLLVVIKDILDFSKIESGKLTLEQIEFDFKNLIIHTINTLSVKSREKNIIIKHEISNDIPKVIIGDPVRLNQILINLLGNAIKFTQENGTVRLVTTLGQPVGDEIKILFKIEDNGIGIPKDKLNYIFQSFTQGESNTTRKYGGTGLGLSIVKQLIELQKGEISVDSEVNKGTSFTFYILLKEGVNKKISHIKHKKSIVDNKSIKTLNILLVEDNIINQQLAYDTIISWNKDIKIEVAENGLIALNKVKDKKFDLVLMDIQMPEMDGHEATCEIRKLPEPKCNIPIIAMTAHALKNEKENCIEKGMDDYISKPFDPEELFTKIVYYGSDKKLDNGATISSRQDESVLSNHEYTYISLSSLEKIYQNNTEKIVKIVGMCFNSIPNEIKGIEDSIKKGNFESVKNKAHSLKPKFGYLGMMQMQENAKNIELISRDSKATNELLILLAEIKEYWIKASEELKLILENN